MLETFLILLAGGVMLAVLVSDHRAVTLQWLRLAGILALTFAGLAGYWYWSKDRAANAAGGVALPVIALLAICGQLAFAQTDRRQLQRAFSGVAFVASVATGVAVLRALSSTGRPVAWIILSAAGASAMCGLALMDMLLGHAYLTASKMTMAPFRRLNLALAAAVAARAFTALVVAHFANVARPVDRLWGMYGLLIGTRWLVGLAVPAVFVFMAHDCINRRSTQSATGILYVAGVLIFVGEIIALSLVQSTGLPF